MQHYSSHHFQEYTRHGIRDAYAQLVGMDVDPAPDSAFHFTFKTRRLPNLSVALIGGSAGRTVRTTSHIRDGQDHLVLCISPDALVGIGERSEQEQLCMPGDGHVWMADRPVVCRVPQHYSAAILAMPVAGLAAFDLDLEALAARRVIRRAEVPVLSLLAGYVRGLMDDPVQRSEELPAIAGSHLRDLVLMALGAAGDVESIAQRRGVRGARLAAVKKDIRDRLARREEVSLEVIAAAHKVTPRYVRSLFQSADESFTDYVLGQRLARAYRELTDPRTSGRLINVIAYDAGFNNISYFIRAFRRRFGMTPSEARAGGLARI
jgi:Response regulator containing CheY-like receiver domain and AraC-type DNA-binding domain